MVMPAGLRERSDSAGVALGAWLFLREPIAAEAASRAGYDYVCIDVQHGLQSFDTVTTMLAWGTAGGAFPIVRVPWNEPGFIGRVLDAGALGVIVPMVNTPDEAAAAVAASKYPPLGARSLGPVGAMTRFGPDYFVRANANVLILPMIETAEAVDNVEAIAAVPGVDGLYVGPADLSVSLGLPPAVDSGDARFNDALARTVAACKTAGILAGVHANPELVPRRQAQGFSFITVGYDMIPMMAGISGAHLRRLGSTWSRMEAPLALPPDGWPVPRPALRGSRCT